MEESPFPEWLSKAAKVIFDSANKECDEKRQFLVPIWKRANYYWNDIQDIYWNQLRGDWGTFDEEGGETEIDAIKDSNKIINSYRAYGESNIAAATIGNLSIRFFPENADDPADLDKAKSFSDKADYVQRVNNITELRREAFRIRYNEGLVASYVYYKRDKNRFGVFKKDVVGIEKSVVKDYKCTNPECDTDIPSVPYENTEQLEASALPDIDPMLSCPGCESPVEQTDRIEEVPKVTGQQTLERGCSVIELRGPLEFKVPHYAKKPRDIDYVVLEDEVHYSVARSLYPKFASKINPGNVTPAESYDRVQADNYASLSSNQLVTITRFWCKPNRYNTLHPDMPGEGEDKAVAKLLKAYPDGKFATFINRDIMVECRNEDMDACWTFVESPLDTHVYLRPLGNSMIPVQDMENDMTYIVMDTIRHSIGETFYDAEVINADAYRKQMAQPGSMYPIDNKRNKPISEYFYSTKNASLSQEVERFQQRLTTSGQLVTGALPSVFGGMFEEGTSKTLGVYEQSRTQALQRIAMPASAIDNFLAKTVHKATELYDKNMDGDESVSMPNGPNNYKNVTLRKSVPSASISRVEVVKSEQFPMTWEQQRAFAMEIFEKQIPELNAFLLDSQNSTFMNQIVGIPGLKVPGEADRHKQLHEIQELLNGEPIPPPTDPFSGVALDPMTGQPMMPVSTVVPEYETDNHLVHMQTIIAWAVSEEGQRAKLENREGYDNTIAHLIEHKMMLFQQQAELGGSGDAPPEEGEGAE